MTDFIKLFGDIQPIFGGSIALGLAFFGWLWTQRSSRDMSAADSSGQIKALAVYEAMLDDERGARKLAEQRADEFARERNEAIGQFYKLQGQMSEMTKQMEQQGKQLEIQSQQIQVQSHQLQEQSHLINNLRLQISHLEEKLKNVS